jgi:hypothetical protein
MFQSVPFRSISDKTLAQQTAAIPGRGFLVAVGARVQQTRLMRRQTASVHYTNHRIICYMKSGTAKKICLIFIKHERAGKLARRVYFRFGFRAQDFFRISAFELLIFTALLVTLACRH